LEPYRRRAAFGCGALVLSCCLLVAPARAEGPAPAAAPPEEPSPAVAADHLPRTFDNTTTKAEKHTIGSEYPGKEGKGFKFQIETTTTGAAIHTLKLSEHFATVADKQLFQKDGENYAQSRLKDPKTYRGHYSLLNPVSQKKQTCLPFETRALTYHVVGEAGPRTVNLRGANWRRLPQEQLPTQPAGTDGDSIGYSCTFYRGKSDDEAKENPILRLEKVYAVSKNSYSFRLSLTVKNLSDRSIRVWIDQLGPTGVPREEIGRGDHRSMAYGRFVRADGEVKVARRPSFDEVQQKLDAGKIEPFGRSDDADPVVWVGHVNKFFGSMMYLVPDKEGKGRIAAEEPEKVEFYVTSAWESPYTKTHVTGVRLGRTEEGKGTPLKPKGQNPSSRTFRFDVFAGPKSRTLLTEHALYGPLGYRNTIDVSRGCFCAFDWLAWVMMWLLEKLSFATFRNYGLAIILLVIVVRILLHPLTKKGQVSMAKMQKLAPQMKKLQEKYKDDKAALNKEMMALYRQGGASPFLGCLPMLLQMPIWIALWTSINATVELRHAGLLPFWLTDLSAPDKLLTWERPVPFLGTSFNLLPILLAIAMYLQTKLTPSMTGQAAVTPDQQKQQKLMQVMIPAIMLFFFYGAASGLTLYIMASIFGGVVEQKVIRKHIAAREAAEAEKEVTVQTPGKAARAKRPKKPKGPFWMKRN
jgi:YidC/Oxa1 family membrane protein insertase